MSTDTVLGRSLAGCALLVWYLVSALHLHSHALGGIPEGPGRWLPPEGLPRPGVIEGTVRDGSHRPEAVVVDLEQYTRGSFQTTVSANERGEFAAPSLPFGRYWLRVRGDLVGDVELTTSQPEVKVKLFPPPAARLSGVVREKKTGRPIRGALVALGLRSGIGDYGGTAYAGPGNCYEWVHYGISQVLEFARQDGVPYSLTDKDGRYEMKLGDETGTLLAIAPDSRLFPAQWLIKERQRGGISHDFGLLPTDQFQLRGVITLPDGRPFANGTAKLVMHWLAGGQYDIKTDEVGRYALLPKPISTSVQRLEVEGYASMHRHVPLRGDTPPPPWTGNSGSRSQAH